MSEPAWLGYTGAVTGIIGAITGIAGAIMGYVSYRRTEQLKTLDLRVELRKLLTDVRALCADIPEVMARASRSRKAVTAAIGGRSSGAVDKWDSELADDEVLLKSFQTGLPDADATFADASQKELEDSLLHFYALQGQAAGLREKYLSALAADERQRDHIREDTRARTQAKIAKGP